MPEHSTRFSLLLDKYRRSDLVQRLFQAEKTGGAKSEPERLSPAVVASSLKRLNRRSNSGFQERFERGEIASAFVIVLYAQFVFCHMLRALLWMYFGLLRLCGLSEAKIVKSRSSELRVRFSEPVVCETVEFKSSESISGEPEDYISMDEITLTQDFSAEAVDAAAAHAARFATPLLEPVSVSDAVTDTVPDTAPDIVADIVTDTATDSVMDAATDTVSDLVLDAASDSAALSTDEFAAELAADAAVGAFASCESCGASCMCVRNAPDTSDAVNGSGREPDSKSGDLCSEQLFKELGEESGLAGDGRDDAALVDEKLNRGCCCRSARYWESTGEEAPERPADAAASTCECVTESAAEDFLVRSKWSEASLGGSASRDAEQVSTMGGEDSDFDGDVNFVALDAALAAEAAAVETRAAETAAAAESGVLPVVGNAASAEEAEFGDATGEATGDAAAAAAAQLAQPEAAYDEDRAEALKAEGNRLLAAAELDRAIAAYREAVQLTNPESAHLKAVLLGNLSYAYGKAADWERAEEAARLSVASDAQYYKGFLRLYAAQYARDNLADAVANLKSACEDAQIAGVYGSELLRLQQRLEQQQAREREEMLQKLKGLGNWVLGKVGMSVEDFETVQDPNTGSYSIQYKGKTAQPSGVRS